MKAKQNAIEAANSAAEYRHLANDWACIAYAGLQWLKNIKDGIPCMDEAIENMTECITSTAERRPSETDQPAAADSTAPATELADGWRLVEKTTHYQLNCGNEVVATLAGPDAAENAAILSRVLSEAKSAAALGQREQVAVADNVWNRYMLARAELFDAKHARGMTAAEIADEDTITEEQVAVILNRDRANDWRWPAAQPVAAAQADKNRLDAFARIHAADFSAESAAAAFAPIDAASTAQPRAAAQADDQLIARLVLKGLTEACECAPTAQPTRTVVDEYGNETRIWAAQPTSSAEYVTRESALEALEHVEQHNGPGRKAEAVAMLEAAQPALPDDERAARFLEAKAADFAREFGTMDTSTGFLYFKDEEHAEIYAELMDRVDARRALAAKGGTT